MKENKTKVVDAANGIDEQKPGIKARRVLASISRKHGLELLVKNTILLNR